MIRRVLADADVILMRGSSKFDDFKDSVQHFAALRNQCDCIVTRNFKDYLHSKLPAYSPIELISLY